MYKTALLSVLGFLAVSASNVMEIPNENWLRVMQKESAIKMQLYGHKLGSEAGPVSWSECDSQRQYDVASGTASPMPLVVGDFVSLGLEIIFNNDINLVGNYVNVRFTAENTDNPIGLFAMDYPAAIPGLYGAGDEYVDKISWFVPSFAPLGHYNVQISVHGKDKVKDLYACLMVDFDIFQ